METEGLNRQATLHLPIGHLLVVWDVLSNRLADTNYKDEFTVEEKRAIWALEDLCEKELVRNGFGGRQQEDWNQLMEQATEFVKTIPVEFLE
jgi:hypothetical protein